MSGTSRAWRRHPDVAWIGDDIRVVAARTSPPDGDGPRILEGAAAWIWMRLEVPQTESRLAEESGHPDQVRQAMDALAAARLIEDG
jgi:hypothetical protein